MEKMSLLWRHLWSDCVICVRWAEGWEDGLIILARPLGRTLVNLRKLWVLDLSKHFFLQICVIWTLQIVRKMAHVPLWRTPERFPGFCPGDLLYINIASGIWKPIFMLYLMAHTLECKPYSWCWERFRRSTLQIMRGHFFSKYKHSLSLKKRPFLKEMLTATPIFCQRPRERGHDANSSVSWFMV